MPQERESGSLPLSRVVLYKHGIGYFERRGRVDGACEIELNCAADAVDDMLKSLLVLNLGGGRVTQVTYDCSKTIESRLSEFGFDMRQCRGLVDLISQLKGIPVTVKASGESIAGRVVGLDEIQQKFHDSVVEDTLLVLYTEDGKFKRFSLTSISDIAVEDAAAAKELEDQLKLLFRGTQKKDARTLRVCFEGAEQRDVLLAYSIPCPIWKTSYRLAFLDHDSLLLQGTAIVDNVQDEDWREVEMVLVSAAPISFIQPLYDPIQPYRPTIAPQGIDSSGPVVAERGQQVREELAETRMKRMFAGRAPASGGLPAAGWGAAPQQEADSQYLSLDQAMMVQAQADELMVAGQESGELFEYKIGTPVTVPRDSSALIPIVNEKIEGERISLYNAERNKRFPFATVKLKNTTGLTLEGGPVTVMEEDAYAGEALLEVLKPGDSRFLPYALDQGCHVLVRSDYKRRPLWRLRIWHGILYTDYRQHHGQLYHLENLSERAKTVYVEHPFRADTKIVGPDKPLESTESYYRFRVDLGARESHTLEVWEESEATRQVRVDDPDLVDVSLVKWLLEQNFVDKRFSDLLKLVLDRTQKIRELSDTKRQLEVLLAQFTSDQERARENIKTLGTSAERYRKAIDQAEDKIVETSGAINQVTETIGELRNELSDMVKTELVLVLEEEVASKE